MDYDYSFKVGLIGSSSVGKSCLNYRYYLDKFPTATQLLYETRALNVGTRTINIGTSRCQLTIYDWENSLTNYSKYHKLSTQGQIFIYDITDANSFETLKPTITRIRKYQEASGNDLPYLLLVGNKCDLDSKRAVSCEEARQYAASMKTDHYETSAQLSVNVEEIFAHLATEILDKIFRIRQELGLPLDGKQLNQTNE